MFERIMVTLDGSRFSGRALPYAVETAKRFGAELLLLEVVPPERVIPPAATSPAGPVLSPEAMRIMVKSAKDQDNRKVAAARRYLKTKLREVGDAGIKTSCHVLIGDPAKEIIRFGKKESVDLVVMATKGKKGLKRAFLGSVADEVVRQPGLPVLVIRPQERTKKK